MKEITIGDISIYSEDGDTWEDLIKVIGNLLGIENEQAALMHKIWVVI